MIVFSQPAIIYIFYILFICCVNLGVKKKSPLNPYFIFTISLVSLILYNPKLSYFLIDIPLEIYLLIFSGMSSFLLGMFVVDKSKMVKKVNTTISNKKLFWVVLSLGFIPHIIGFMEVGIPILNQNELGEARVDYLPGGLSYFIFFLPLAITIAFSMKNKKLILLTIVLNAAISLVRVSKFDILIFVIFLLFSHLKYSQKKSLPIRKYLIFSSVFIAIPLIFDWFHSLRFQQESDNFNFQLSTTSIFESLSILISLPYLYLTTAWSNFTQTVLSVTEFNYGAYTFFPFYSAMQLDGLISKVSSKVIYRHPFNTHAFLTDFYMDFGILGVIIVPFLIGLLVFYSYKKSLVASDPIKDGQYMILAIPTLMLFFSNHFTSVGYPFIVYLLYGFIGFLSRIKIKI